MQSLFPNNACGQVQKVPLLSDGGISGDQVFGFDSAQTEETVETQ